MSVKTGYAQVSQRVITIPVDTGAEFAQLPTGYEWADPNLTFSFPATSSMYYVPIGPYVDTAGSFPTGFVQLNEAQQEAVISVLQQYASVSGLTFTQIPESDTQHADLREAQSSAIPDAQTFGPSLNFNVYSDDFADSFYTNIPGRELAPLVTNPVLGAYGYDVYQHELGLALGLTDDVDCSLLPPSKEEIAYSMESWCPYAGASPQVTINNIEENVAFPETIMQDDIAAIQYMYGPNFSAVGTNRVYSWDPDTGEEFINGAGQGLPGANMIFSTIWDQAASTTYDLSNYSSDLNINLQPGAWSTFSAAQVAILGTTSGGAAIYAPGNVANAQEYDNNPLTLVHAVIGGSGNNTIVGNNAGDYIYGGTGGNNTIQAGSGNNFINGGTGGTNTMVFTGPFADYTITQLSSGALQVVDTRAGSPDGTDVITNIQKFQFSDGTHTFAQVSATSQDSQWAVSGLGDFSSVPNESDLLMQNTATGQFELYDISHNTVTNNVSMGQVGLEWQLSGFGDLSGNTNETDMLMQDSNTGGFEVYDIANNAIANAQSMGAVGAPWNVVGFGDFSSNPGETDMLMQNGSTGQFEVYDIAHNTITYAASMGQIGLEWQIVGFGDFSGKANETDMLIRDTSNGQFYVFDISGNTITSATSIGAVGMEWKVLGVGDFSTNPGETDMLLQNTTNGQLELYDIVNNAITNAFSIGQIGLEWNIIGMGDLSGNANETDMFMQNSSTRQYEYYDISHNGISTAGPLSL